MLPGKLRAKLFEKMSIKTMRFVSSVPARRLKGLLPEPMR